MSRCLDRVACRYDGEAVECGFLEDLGPHAEILSVCPELEIGLGVPRPPIRIERPAEAPPGDSPAGASDRLIEPSSGRDLTGPMRRFAGPWLEEIGLVDGFILKSRSPACGLRDTGVFTGPHLLAERTAGFFARAVLERFPHAVIEDDERLTLPALRRAYLVRLFASARLRELDPSSPPGVRADLLHHRDGPGWSPGRPRPAWVPPVRGAFDLGDP